MFENLQYFRFFFFFYISFYDFNIFRMCRGKKSRYPDENFTLKPSGDNQLGKRDIKNIKIQMSFVTSSTSYLLSRKIWIKKIPFMFFLQWKNQKILTKNDESRFSNMTNFWNNLCNWIFATLRIKGHSLKVLTFSSFRGCYLIWESSTSWRFFFVFEPPLLCFSIFFIPVRLRKRGKN